VKVKQSYYRPGQPLRVSGVWGSHISSSRHMEVARLATLRAGRFYHPGNIPGTHFCYRLGRPQGHSAAGMIMSMKNFSDNMVSRIRDLPACSSVLQRTTPPPVLSSQWGPVLDTSHGKVVGKRQFFLNFKACSKFGCGTWFLRLMWKSRLTVLRTIFGFIVRK
jgi:hypothetical protein